MMSYFWRVATTIWHWICWCAATLFLVIVYPLVLCGLVLYLLPDLFQKRESKPSISPIPAVRKLQRPRRYKDKVFVVNPDGTEIEIEPLQAKLLFMEWAEVFSSLPTYEKVKG